MAVLTPMPKASVTIERAANAGARRSRRKAYRTSDGKDHLRRALGSNASRVGRSAERFRWKRRLLRVRSRERLRRGDGRRSLESRLSRRGPGAARPQMRESRAQREEVYGNARLRPAQAAR